MRCHTILVRAILCHNSFTRCFCEWARHTLTRSLTDLSMLLYWQMFWKSSTKICPIVGPLDFKHVTLKENMALGAHLAAEKYFICDDLPM